MNDVKFLYGTKANYDTLAAKDSNTLYFLTDTLQIFKGTDEYTKTAKLVSSLPTTGQVQGVIYINTTDFSMHIYNGADFVPINKSYATTIPTNPNDDTVPTTKAVATYVTNKIADVVGGVGTFVTDVTYIPATGALSVAKGGEPVNTVLTGIVNKPTYDAETRTITLPVFGEDSLVIALGKDAFVESGSYNAKTESIDLVLTSGDEVHVPVGSLISVFTGLATPSAAVTVSAENKISVNVKVSSTANNQITIEEDGLYVPLPDAYTKAETDTKIKVVSDALTEHTGNTDVHVTASQKTEWSNKATVEQVTAAKDAAIAAAAQDATTKSNKALEDAKVYSDGLNAAIGERVATVESTLQWKTIV